MSYAICIFYTSIRHQKFSESHLKISLHFLQLDIAVIFTSFGIGLLVAGHYIIGPAFIAFGAILYIINSYQYHQAHRVPHKVRSRHNHYVRQDPTLEQKLRALDAWYYSKDGEVVGPVAEGQLLTLFDIKAISENTLVYNSEVGKVWRPFGEEFSRFNRNKDVRKSFLK